MWNSSDIRSYKYSSGLYTGEVYLLFVFQGNHHHNLEESIYMQHHSSINLNMTSAKHLLLSQITNRILKEIDMSPQTLIN